MSKQKVIVSVDLEWLFAKHEAELREQIANELKEWNKYEGVFAEGIEAAIRKVRNGISKVDSNTIMQHN